MSLLRVSLFHSAASSSLSFPPFSLSFSAFGADRRASTRQRSHTGAKEKPGNKSCWAHYKLLNISNNNKYISYETVPKADASNRLPYRYNCCWTWWWPSWSEMKLAFADLERQFLWMKEKHLLCLKQEDLTLPEDKKRDFWIIWESNLFMQGVNITFATLIIFCSYLSSFSQKPKITIHLNAEYTWMMLV